MGKIPQKNQGGKGELQGGPGKRLTVLLNEKGTKAKKPVEKKKKGPAEQGRETNKKSVNRLFRLQKKGAGETRGT